MVLFLIRLNVMGTECIRIALSAIHLYTEIMYFNLK